MPTAPEDPPHDSVCEQLFARHGAGATISLETFVHAALYAPGSGYYRRSRERVGYRSGRDFYTAESLGPVFRELVLAAILQSLPAAPRSYHFIELGAEGDRHLFHGVEHPFASASGWNYGHELRLEGSCVLFSNELFDAQPFRRFEAIDGEWREHGVELLGPHQLRSCLLAETSAPLPADLPPADQPGYLLDYPSGARQLALQIARQPWRGLFLAFDYGFDRETLFRHRPRGTARTYRQHRSGTDLLGSPGHLDITHHICWDHLQDALRNAGFEQIGLQTQEGFFMHRSAATIEKLVRRATRPGLHRDLQTLKELLHPENMGRKFQVLHGLRTEYACQARTPS